VLSVLFERRRMRTLLATTPQRPPLAGPASLPSRSGSLTEVEVKALVAGYGITTTRDTVVDSLDAARAAAARLGFPVVLKGVSETVTHKSDAGLVAVGIGDEQALATAWARVTGALAATDPGRAPRVAVMEMVRGEGELIVGARWTAFGAQVMAGAGGTMVEVEDDVAFALAPVTPDQARDLLMGLRIARRMGGVRGRPAWDVDAAVDAIVRLSWLAADAGPRLIELDINPLIVRAIGEGAVAVDARATLESA
jgi:acetyl-CoA synthetase (ADP-forming)